MVGDATSTIDLVIMFRGTTCSAPLIIYLPLFTRLDLSQLRSPSHTHRTLLEKPYLDHSCSELRI